MPFTPAALRYLRQLAAHNEKPWFEAHRAEYEQDVREPMLMLIEEMLMRFRKLALEIGGDPKRRMFRINRDVRFSKDKSPYKTHVRAGFIIVRRAGRSALRQTRGALASISISSPAGSPWSPPVSGCRRALS